MVYSVKEQKAFEKWYSEYSKDKSLLSSHKIVAKATWWAGIEWCDEQERI